MIGRMQPLFTPAQVRAMDRRAIAGGVPGAALMERAAGHLARGIVRVAGRAYGLRVALLCGRGNNGGDGLAAGRRLLGMGAAPVVVLVAGEEGLGPDGLRELRAYRAAGGRLAPAVAAALAGADVAVDCLLGTGTRGSPRPPLDGAVTALLAFDGSVVACDLPTGVDADTGEVPGPAVRADLTVTFGARKRGLALWPARGHVGEEVVGDLGIVTPDDDPVAHVLDAADVGRLVPPPPPDAEKRTRGVVVILAGSAGMAGAAVMAARGAMRAGAGLVTVATGDPSLVTAAVPEALTVRVRPHDARAAHDALAPALAGADALAVGPGLGRDDTTAALVRRIVREAGVPLVLDADGINVFRGDAGALADHASPLLVLTPHTRELARLTGLRPDEAYARRATLLPELAAAWGAVVVAKGPGTLVAAPDGRAWVTPTGGPALSTGGTGDVLTGMTATLVAQRADAAAVAAAVWLHGRAGEHAGRTLHPRSATALDVAAAIPRALHTLPPGPDHARLRR